MSAPALMKELPMTVDWYKSSYSTNEDSCCVEVAHSGGELTRVRDSKVVNGPVVLLSNAAWGQFVAMHSVPGSAA